MWLGLILTVLLLLASGLALYARNTQKTLPKSIAQEASTSMRVYFYGETIPDNFSLDEDTVQLSAGVLTFTLVNKHGQHVVISEQSLPKNLLESTVAGGEKVDGARGSAAVNFKEGRATATFITEDRQTLVVLNSTDSIEESTMKDLVRALKPL